MKNKRLEELEAQVEHLQDRLDNFRDLVEKRYTSADHYWRKFEDLLAWAKRFDANSDEYQKLLDTAWLMLGRYLDVLSLKIGAKDDRYK